MKKVIMYKEQEVNWRWYYQPWGGELADGKRCPEKKRHKASRIEDADKEASLRVLSPDTQSILLRAGNRNAILSPPTSPCSWCARQIWLSCEQIYSSGKQSWVNLISHLIRPWGRFQICSSAQHYLVSCRALSLLLPPSLKKKLHFLVSWRQKGDYCSGHSSCQGLRHEHIQPCQRSLGENVFTDTENIVFILLQITPAPASSTSSLCH